MRLYARKQAFYFRQDDKTDQALYRLLMRYQPVARTKLFRDIVRRGYRQYLKHRRTRKEPAKGSTLQKQEPVSHTVAPRPVDDSQPWN